jgi:hypothetical protein
MRENLKLRNTEKGLHYIQMEEFKGKYNLKFFPKLLVIYRSGILI